MGGSVDELTHAGPVISAAALRRIAGIVDRARTAGATVIDAVHCLSPGKEDWLDGFYFPPTIVCCDDAGPKSSWRRLSAPSLSCRRPRPGSRLSNCAMESSRGLSPRCSRTPESTSELFVSHARAGLLKINDRHRPGAAADAPFGGWKESGSRSAGTRRGRCRVLYSLADGVQLEPTSVLMTECTN